MQTKKVLVVCQHFWPESFRINDICDYLVEKGCNVEVLCGIPNYPKGQFFDGYSYFRNRHQVHKGIKIHRAFEIPRGKNTNARVFFNYVSFPFASLFHLPRLLTKKYDKIFLYQLSPVMMVLSGIIVGKLKRIETTMYVLDLWPENLFSVLNTHSTLLRKLATRVSHWHYKKVDKLIVLSETMKKHLIEITKIPESRIIVLPQAAEKIYEIDMFDARLTDRFQGGFNILFTGNISPAQSFETILAAAKKLHDWGISNINWIIVGDGMSRQWLEKEVEKAGLTSSFYFEGLKPIEDIPKYTTMADLLIGCLVKSELLEATIPAKVMSYFAAGKPMVLAMDGEVQYLVNKIVRCGYVCPTGDEKALAENIKRAYLLSPEQRKKMGERGRNYHMHHFERSILLQKLVDFVFQDKVQ